MRDINWKNEIPTETPGKEHGVEYLTLDDLCQAIERRLLNRLTKELIEAIERLKKT